MRPLHQPRQDVPPDTTPTHKVFFDVAVDGEPAGRVTFGLYGHVAPRTVENFRALCAGDKGATASGVPLHFKGSKLHRIIPGFMCVPSAAPSARCWSACCAVCAASWALRAQRRGSRLS
jgi:hypothetical protein